MGAYCDNRILTAQQTGIIMDSVMQPAIAQMAKDGSPFTGFLYAGLMMTAIGPKILEFNVRLGDPETQALMYGFEGDLGELLMQSTSSERKLIDFGIRLEQAIGLRGAFFLRLSRDTPDRRFHHRASKPLRRQALWYFMRERSRPPTGL